MTDVLFLIGRILFGGFFLMMGMMHFLQLEALAGYAASKKVPAPKLAVVGTGLLLLAGGLSVLLGVLIPWGVAALAIFLLPVSFQMHNFWAIEDPQMKQIEMTNFLKNIALLGGALFLLNAARWPFSLGG